MSDILIKGMGMPKYPTAIRIQVEADGSVYQNSDKTGNGWALQKNVTATEVPPHGRLIDEQWLKDAMITTLEALKKNPKMDRQEMHLIAAFDTLRVMVEDAPTIIEKEDGT